MTKVQCHMAPDMHLPPEVKTTHKQTEKCMNTFNWVSGPVRYKNINYKPSS